MSCSATLRTTRPNHPIPSTHFYPPTLTHGGRYDSWAIVFAYFLPVPSALIYAAAGWTGMSLRRFLLLDVIGTALWIITNVGLGYFIGQSAVNVAKGISRYGLILTLLLIAVVMIVAARREWRVAARGVGTVVHQMSC